MRPAPRASRAAVLGLAMLLALGATAAAQTRPRVLQLEETPRSALYLDGSFYFDRFRDLDGLAGHLSSLLLGAGASQRFHAAAATIAGTRLHWHDPVAFVLGRPRPAARSATADPLEWRAFDIAIMADCGDCPADPRALGAYVARTLRDAEVVRKQGGEPVFFMPWTESDRPEAIRRIAEATTVAANANDALVIPAGLAFARARAQRPGLVLVEDRLRPTLAGAYLAAAVSYASLFGLSPVGNRATGGLDAEAARFLQHVAWETVWEFYAGRRPPE